MHFHLVNCETILVVREKRKDGKDNSASAGLRGDTAQVTINGRSTANRAGVTRRERKQ